MKISEIIGAKIEHEFHELTRIKDCRKNLNIEYSKQLKFMKHFLLTILIALSLLACKNTGTESQGAQSDESISRDSLIYRIELLEQKIDTRQAIDYNFAGELVNAYTNFFNSYPKDALAADYLFKAAEVSMNAKQSQKAIELLAKFVDLYPDHQKSSFALFMQAFIYETQLGDIDEAKKLYTQVIDYYPSTRLAEDAKACIQNLGKSESQLIEEFEKKNKLQ